MFLFSNRMKTLHLGEEDDSEGLLEQLEKERKLEEERERDKEEEEFHLALAEATDDEDEKSEREKKMWLLHEQDCLLHQVHL